MMNQSPRRARCTPPHEAGVALIVVLSFVVLLTALVVAYFSRAAADRQLSNSSLNQATVDDLARGAADIITADLKQEIVNGSTPVLPVTLTRFRGGLSSHDRREHGAATQRQSGDAAFHLDQP